MKKENLYALIGALIGIVGGFLFQAILFWITDINFYNIFFTPLYDIIPLMSIVPIIFSITGAIIGTIVGGLIGKKK